MGFLAWFYSNGIQLYINIWSNSYKWILHYFSFTLLIKTLFSPWKRLTVIDTSPGFDLQKKLEVVIFNTISRGVGFCVRIIFFWLGIALIVFNTLLGAIGFLIWTVVPVFAYPGYRKYKRSPQNYVKDLVAKIDPGKNPVESIFTSEAGQFVLSHIGIPLTDLIKNAQTNLVNFKNLNLATFAQLVEYLIKNGVWKEDFFNKFKVASYDLISAGAWWDKIRFEETRSNQFLLARPSIALELTFGFTATLDKYSSDLSLPLSYSHRLIGRESIVSRIERVLSSGNSVLLVGEPGVGKKTVVLEFAKRAREGQLGHEMSYKRVLEFDYNALLSETSDLNKKKTNLAQILTEASEAGNIILMIRDIQRITNHEVEGYDFTDIFEEHLEKRGIKIIAVSTLFDYERFISHNLRLRKYFERIEVVPPSKELAFEILIEAARRWELTTKLTITVPSLRHILNESDRYITEVPFPEKALEFLDAVISFCQQKGESVVTIEDVNSVLSERTGISFARLSQEEKTRLGKIEEIIHQRLINQDTAVTLIGKSLRARETGVIKENRPVGSLLFLGPTGVGKTETAKILAKVYYGSEENIIRFDMAEYSGSEGLERLIGSLNKNLPGVLTTAIKNRPASLLLLDEIEKAKQEVYNLFLSLLDEGIVTDAFGKKIICRHLFVIGTSNASGEYIRQLVSQKVMGEELQKKVVNHVLESEVFSPEFINRFDGAVVYEPLNLDNLIKIANLMLNDLKANLRKKNIFLQVSEEVCLKLAKDGFEPEFGARPMKRIVKITLGDLIAKAILNAEIKEGDKIKIVAGPGKEEYRLEKFS